MSNERSMGFPNLRPLLSKAGLPEESHEEMIDLIARFTTSMVVLMEANDDVAKNYLTFSMDTPDGQNYELTIRKCDGKAPADIIEDLMATVKNLEGKLAVTEAELAEFEGA